MLSNENNEREKIIVKTDRLTLIRDRSFVWRATKGEIASLISEHLKREGYDISSEQILSNTLRGGFDPHHLHMTVDFSASIDGKIKHYNLSMHEEKVDV